MNTTLKVHKVTTRYKNSKSSILENISLNLNKNEILVVLGPSGSGKTTLLNLIAGFIKPTSGELYLNNNLITKPSAKRAVVFQDHALLPWKNVIENVTFGLKLAKVPKAIQLEIATSIIKQVELSGYEKRYIWELSGGQKQRVGIARALAVNPDLLLLDEPFASLDIIIRKQMQELILKIWNDTKKNILIITHDIEEAILLASRIIVLSGNPSKIKKEFKLEFNKQYLNGNTIFNIKKSKSFIDTYEQIIPLLTK